MGETLEKTGSRTGGRSRSGARSEGSGKGRKVESPIVTRVLQLTGTVAKSSLPGGSPTETTSTLTKENKENQRQYWSQRIADLVKAIETDLQTLGMMLGTEGAVQEWRAKLERAKAPQKEGRWQDSHIDITEVQAALRLSVSEQSQQKLQELKSSVKIRKEYEKLSTELVQMKEQLGEYPDAEVLCGKFAADAEVGALHYAEDRFTQALQAMKLAHATAKSDLADQKKRYSESTAMGSPFKDVAGKLETLVGLIDEKGEVVGPLVVAPFLTQAEGLQKEMYAALEGGAAVLPGKKRDVQTNLSKSLTTRAGSIETAMLKAVNLADQQYRSAQTLMELLQTRVADGGEVQAASAVQAAYQTLQQMRNAIGAREYARALEIGAGLETTMEDWPELPPPGGEERFKAIDKVARAQFLQPARVQLQRAKALRDAAATVVVLTTPPVAQDTVTLLQDQIDAYELSPPTYPVGEGIDTVGRVTTLNDLNEARQSDWLALDAKRTEFGQRIDALVVRMNKRLEELKSSLATGGPITRLPAYENARDAALEQWRVAAEGATTLEGLPFAAVKAQLEGVLTQIADDAKDPEALKDRAAEGRFATLKGAFETANGTATRAVEALTEASYDAGDTQLGLLTKARDRFFVAMKKKDAGAAQLAVDAVAAVEVEAQKGVTAAGLALQQAKAAWTRESGPVNESLSTLVGRVKTKKLAAYAGMVATLLTEKQTMWVVVQQSSDASVLTALIEDLQGLKADIAAVKLALDKIDSKAKAAPGDLSIETLKKRAEGLIKAFGDKTVKKMEPDALKALAAKCQAIIDALGTTKLGDSDEQLTALAEEWAALQKKVRDHEAAIAQFVLDVGTTRTSVTQANIGVKYPDYVVALGKRLDALEAGAKAGTEDAAGLTTLKKEFADALLHTGALQVKNDQAQSDALAEAVAEKKWASDYAAFQGRLLALKLVKKGIADPDKKSAFEAQAKQIVDASKELSKREGKTPYATMNEQLQALMSNLNTLIEYPMGVETHSRGQVMTTIKEWNGAVTAFHEKVDAMLRTVGSDVGGSALASEAKVSTVKAVNERAARERALLAINTITPMATKMLAAEDDVDAARDARELAMREVKRLQRIVEGAPLRALASGNAFDTTMLDALRNMSAKLFDVETNLTISL